MTKLLTTRSGEICNDDHHF